MIVISVDILCLVQGDILHPLATIKWDRRGSLPEALPESIQVILVNDRLCVGTEYTVYLSSSDFKTWKTMVTRAHDFALACYDSKILTIGGLDSACSREISGDSWFVDVVGQTYTPSSLPPLQEKRHSASAINVPSAECLVVAGGADDEKVLDSVEVLLCGRWVFVQRLPSPQFGLRGVLHDGVLYLTGNSLDGVYSCELCELLQSHESLDCEGKQGSSFGLWRVVSSSLSHKSLVSFGKRFCVVGVDTASSLTKIDALREGVSERRWAHLAEVPVSVKNRVSVVLSNGNLVVVGKESPNIYRGVLHSKLIIWVQ